MTRQSMTGVDDDLRSAFAELRREEQAHAPAFSAFSQPARARGYSRPRLVAVAVCLAASLAAVIWLVRPAFERPRRQLDGPTVSITEWKPATEFLLDTPGSELLRTVPALGADAGYGKPSEPEPKHPKRAKYANKTLP